MKIYNINIQTHKGPMTVEMTAEQFTKWHDELTSWYNDNYQELNADPEEVEQAEQERNIDHANDNRI